MAFEPTERVPLGRTGLSVTRLGLGGAAIGGVFDAVERRRGRGLATLQRLGARHPLLRRRAAVRLRDRRAPPRARWPAGRATSSSCRPRSAGWSAAPRSGRGPTSTGTPSTRPRRRSTNRHAASPPGLRLQPRRHPAVDRGEPRSGSGSTGSTSSSSTIRTTTGRPRSARPTRPSTGCARMASSARSGRDEPVGDADPVRPRGRLRRLPGRRALHPPRPGRAGRAPADVRRAERRGVIGGVMNSGILADPGHAARFNYKPAPADVVERARRLADVCERHGVPLKAAAIQFPLAHRRSHRSSRASVGSPTSTSTRHRCGGPSRPTSGRSSAAAGAEGAGPEPRHG